MKKNNLKRGILAIALATSFVLGSGQSLTNVHAANEVSQEKSAKEMYEDSFKQLKDTYNSYLNLYDDYTYINSTSYPKASFDGIMTKTKAYLEEEKVLTSDEEYKLEAETAMSQLSLLNEAKDKLDGESVDTETLAKLLMESQDFVRNDSNYKNAPKDKKDLYDLAITNGYLVFNKGSNKLSEGEYEKAVADIREAREAIIRAVKENAAKEELGTKIKETEEIVKNKDKYTENTYKMFDLALTSAKSIENNPNSKLEEYEESIKSLKEATEGLELKEDADKIKKALKELKAAKEEHEITVKACKMLLNYPAIEKNNGDRIRAYLEKSAKVIERANKILEHYGMN
ncbi:MAG: hypothetical protein E7C95_08395 [Anaerococcus prevotii]|uniref:hypothetical protein n=1 Tax=Anaerococcus prevotii TaxID=33034 RepID=UPI002904675C|nr:hypothetical protein [Anaerococcus prevotii]MDU2558983.1 hypothetical protein [Anaerococcus prevotii]